LRIIPIGGLDEVGKNTMIFEYEDAIFLVDLGFEFPSEDLLGVDYVIPDIDYLKDKAHKIKGIIWTILGEFLISCQNWAFRRFLPANSRWVWWKNNWKNLAC
jgi:hypothetical protein